MSALTDEDEKGNKALPCARSSRRDAFSAGRAPNRTTRAILRRRLRHRTRTRRAYRPCRPQRPPGISDESIGRHHRLSDFREFQDKNLPEKIVKRATRRPELWTSTASCPCTGRTILYCSIEEQSVFFFNNHRDPIVIHRKQKQIKQAMSLESVVSKNVFSN